MKGNPILYYIGDIAIRKANQLSISLSETEMAKAAEVSVRTGLSIPKIIALQGLPCQKCGSNEIVIPKSILSTKRTASGGNISSRKKKAVK
jgi:hypothetical protein